jgi:fibronectin-binding autotransporter adhesin
MKRFLKLISALSFWELCGRFPAAAGVLSLLGVGGGLVAAGLLTPPSITPQPSTAFSQSQPYNQASNVLKTNGGTVGAEEPPATSSTTNGNSFFFYLDGNVDPNLGTGNTSYQYALGNGSAGGGLVLSGLGIGSPFFVTQRSSVSGLANTFWWTAISPNSLAAASSATAGTGYFQGYYPFTTTGGGCAREPSGVWYGLTTSVRMSDPGFQCLTTPTISPATIPNDGAQQTPTAVSCASNSPVSGEIAVTFTLPYAHGVPGGNSFTAQGFSVSGSGTYNATYYALSGSTGSTLIGETTTGSGTCPTGTVTMGAILSGTGATITLPTISTTAPLSANANTGITTKPGQHFCGIVGEYGADSPFPGAQYAAFMDRDGPALNSSPAVSTWPNLGGTNFTGYTLVNTQASGSPGTQALAVTAMNSYTISSSPGPAYSASTGYVTFTLSSNPNLFIGSEFTVGGVTNTGTGSFNQTYIAVAGTSGTTVVGNPLSGPLGSPSTAGGLSNTSTATSGGSMAGVIVPGMQVMGATGSASILPFGTFSGTGTGGVGTYGLSSNQVATGTATVTAVNAPSGGVSTMTVTGTPSSTLVVGSSLSGITGYSSPLVITGLGSSTTGGAGTYTVSNPNSGSFSGSVSASIAGTIGSSVSPVTIFAWPAFYYSAAGTPSSTSNIGVLTFRTASTISDYFSYIGGYNTAYPPAQNGWGASLANVGMYYGIFPSTSNSPNASSLTSLCQKTTDFQSFAAANSLAVHSLYRLNDPGTWGDSGNAVITGYITNVGGSAATLNVVSTVNGSLALPSGTETAHIAAPRLNAATSYTIPLTTTASSTYAITPTSTAALGSSGSPVTFSVGAYGPATPLVSGGFNGANGYLAGSTLTVTSIASANKATFVGSTALPTNIFTGSVPNNSNVMTVSGTITPANTMQVGAIITGSGIPANTYITSGITGTVGTGAYALNWTNTTGSTVSGTWSSTYANPILAPTVLNVTSGTPASGMRVTDGGVHITGQPLLITAGSSTPYTLNPNYYPAIASETMYGESTSLVPGQYLTGNSSITTPIKIIGYGTGPSLCATGEWGCGTYTIYNPGSLSIGSSGSPVVFNAGGATDGGAVAPGPALTISDPGPGVTFPVTNYGAGTGAAWLSGAFSNSALGGNPSAVQAQVSLTAGGPPISGCSACAWTNLANATINTGAQTWSGQALNIPAGGPYYISVRAANGTSYATLPSAVKVGLMFDVWGVGQSVPVFTSSNGGSFYSSTPYLWGANVSNGGSFYQFDTGPAVAGTLTPSYFQMLGGDQFAASGATGPLAEGASFIAGTLDAAMGYPVSITNWIRDGTGFSVFAWGDTTQTQTITNAANGTATIFCSASKFCGGSTGIVGKGGTLDWNLASVTGSQITGSIATIGGVSTLTVSTLVTGALMPGLVLSDSSFAGGNGNITGSPALVACVSGCGGLNGASSTWTLGANEGTVSLETMRADPIGGALTPNWNPQVNGVPSIAQYATNIMEAGTFSVSVNGTVVCTDSNTAVWNIMGGNCTGAGISSSFVNYVTGDYQITFSSAPAANAVITASWTEIVSPDGNDPNAINTYANLDLVGNGTATGGFLSAAYSRMPGGSSGHIFAGCTDDGVNLYDTTYAIGALGFTQELNWFYGTKVPSIFPFMSASTPLIIAVNWRGDGSIYFTSSGPPNEIAENSECDQWSNDMTVSSTWSGTINGVGGSTGAWTGTLTLSGAATGPMWEGEVVGCATASLACAMTPGTYIVSLASGAWGASGSTYNLANNTATAIANVGSSTAMTNALRYSAGPSIYAGPMNDNDVVLPGGGVSGTDGYTPHPSFGAFGAPRIGRRWAASIYGGLTGSAANPTLARGTIAACDAAAIASPCFDIGNTYAASASGAISGSTITFSSGISAHARAFVVGQAISCSGCTTGRFITAISVPPTQSTVGGQGEVGQSFTVSASGSLGVSTTETVTAGCSGTSGVGSNCIDLSFAVNTGGTYGTAAALATCGEGNLNGSAGFYQLPVGTCSNNGIGSLVHGFRIGTVQAMNGGLAAATVGLAGSPYDDGADPYGGIFEQSSAFTCNIVAASVVQCVKGAAYSSGVLSSIGEWLTGSAFVEYGDTAANSARMSGLMGNIGGSPFGLTAGSGYVNGTATITATNCQVSGGTYDLPKVDVTVSGGSIVNVYASATGTNAIGYGVGQGCAWTLPSSGPASGGTGGAITASPLWPNDGAYGIAAYNNAANIYGDMLYDNSGLPGNPMNAFFTNGQGGYYEPGLPVRPFGEFMGVKVSG